MSGDNETGRVDWFGVLLALWLLACLVAPIVAYRVGH